LLNIKTGFVIAFAALAVVGCRSTEPTAPSVEGPSLVANGNGPLPRPTAWVDCEFFRSLVTPAVFDPANGNFDELYAGGDGFKNGVPLISDAGPGDTNYNGGRWHVNLLKAGVPADKYAGACSVDDLDLNDFESTANYFECPLLPVRGGGRGSRSE